MKVEVETPETCPTGGDGACYWPALDVIYMPDTRDGLPEVTAHEYGHFMMDKWYGPFDASAGGPHTLCADPQARDLAWGEGFATYYGVSTNQRLAGVPGAEGDTFWKNRDLETYDCGGVPHGDDNEWNVAATMWDLIDSGSDGESVDFASFDAVDIVDDCDHANFQEYYNKASCSWVQHGYSGTQFRTVANKNRIPYT